VVVYLDDILIYSDTLEEHEQHVRAICEILKREGLNAKLSKCSFFKQQVEYLGHVVGNGQLQADPRKLGSVDAWPTPATVGELRSFLGLCSYFRRYIKSFAKIAHPLHDLTGKKFGGLWMKDPSVWSHRHQLAFEELKLALVSAPVLTAPDYSKRFLVYTDASARATGAILAQEDEYGNIRPICFYSRKLKDAEVNYPAHDMELLAIVEALKEWRYFLEGSPFTAIVRTDHKPLQEFFTQKSLSRRQARWWEKIHAFDFEINYVKGIENPADALSRNPIHSPDNSSLVVAYMSVESSCLVQIQAQLCIAALVPDVDFLETIRHEVLVDSWFTSHAAQRMKLECRDGIYYTRAGQIVLPAVNKLKQDIISDAHDSKIAGHRGALGTLKSVALSFW
jgi:ribonuclease HI